MKQNKNFELRLGFEDSHQPSRLFVSDAAAEVNGRPTFRRGGPFAGKLDIISNLKAPSSIQVNLQLLGVCLLISLTTLRFTALNISARDVGTGLKEVFGSLPF